MHMLEDCVCSPGRCQTKTLLRRLNTREHPGKENHGEL